MKKISAKEIEEYSGRKWETPEALSSLLIDILSQYCGFEYDVVFSVGRRQQEKIIFVKIYKTNTRNCTCTVERFVFPASSKEKCDKAFADLLYWLSCRKYYYPIPQDNE